MTMITTRDGTQLYVKDWGPKTGRPVIMMHGWPLTSDTWDDFAVVAADAGFRAISYDRRGFGRSEQPWDGYEYDTLADDLADVIEATGAYDAALFGFSMGGGEVARYMSRHGGKGVSKAALIASVVPYMAQTPDNPDGVPQSVFDEMTAGMKEDRAHFFHGFLKSFYGVGVFTGSVSEAVLDWSFQQTMMAGLRPTLACAKAFSSTDFRPDLPSFKVPTLIIHGTGDQTVPIETSGRAAAAAIPGATLIEYDGAPHGLFASNKQQLTDDLMAFLRS
ncbi:MULTISPECIES: alpha/beta hydrolase [unclassified Rhizobium]|uniref:alpha/beta fold hydrolase n=1 Tax=unclassified Rhizobium TaxID=2613769 RepID=UPI001AE24EB7|nr:MULTISPECIES: alpha/beta hydrolase [unclassified Rhizobium]MBP2460681.1 pimeloyl-ACP methyl ester carboxylesterase [Rhizobium sp. PvP014]MBP2528078.1 pimeloyl-ACP methyl ester carboxylesterase [Rhizobium sp. PvP099]